jgi:hypothetical protein
MASRSWWYVVLLPLLSLCLLGLAERPISAAHMYPNGDCSPCGQCWWEKYPDSPRGCSPYVLNVDFDWLRCFDSCNAYFEYSAPPGLGGQTVQRIRAWNYHHSNEVEFAYSLNGTDWYAGHWIPPSGVGVFSWRYVDIDFTAPGEIGHALTESELQNFKGRLYASPQGDYWVVDAHYVELDPSPLTPTAAVMSSCTRSSPDGTRYSGTGCTITGHWTAGAGRHLTEVKLKVNNICRYRYWWYGSSGPDEWLANAPFSSTQFNDNSVMTLKAECWNDNSASAVDTDSKIAWNRGYISYNTSMKRPPLEGGGGTARAPLTQQTTRCQK